MTLRQWLAAIGLTVIWLTPAAGQPIAEIERNQYIAKSRQWSEEAARFNRIGQIHDAVETIRLALAIDRRLYPKTTHPIGHPELATCVGTLGNYLHRAGKLDEALTHFDEALTMNRAIYPKDKHPAGHWDLAWSLNNLGMLWKAMGDYDRAQLYFEEALAMNRALYPKSDFPQGHADLASCMSNFGLLLRAKGDYQQAYPYCEEALRMRRELFPPEMYKFGHTEVAASLNNLGSLLQDMGQMDMARKFIDQSIEMRRSIYPKERYPNGHVDLAVGLNNYGLMLRGQGERDRARACLEEALVMYRAVYPKDKYPQGHPFVAVCLNNLGLVMDQLGERAVAQDHYRQCLKMRRGMYPETKYPVGHPELISILSNLAGSLKGSGDFDEARIHYDEAVAMARRLYPVQKYAHGHPELAVTTQNLALLLEVTGDMKQARVLFEESLDCKRALFPKERYPFGHASLAGTLENTARHWHRTGDFVSAANLYRETVTMRGALAERFLTAAAEAEAIAYVQSQPMTRDHFLSLAADAPEQIADAYPFVWQTKALLTRILEQRHATARLGGTKHAHDFSLLGQLRRQIERLLLNDRMKPAERDRALTDLADQRDELERKLARALPLLAQWKKRDQLGPQDLAMALPKDAVFIDLLRYHRTQFDATKKAATAETRTPCYAAFVVVPGQATQRVELGQAWSIDRDVNDWRKAIEAGMDSRAAADLRAAVWTKIAAHLPPGCRTIYLSLDGDLARVPWAALPGAAPNTVLLEDYALAVVPHGPFLLDRLQNPRRSESADAVLVLGDLDYGKTPWPALPGTAKESLSIKQMASKPPLVLSGARGTPERLAELLPQVRYAHLATHGEFKAKELALEKSRERAQLTAPWADGASRLSAAKNPLGFTGLVLSEGEILTGLRLVDLPLENLELVTLSACETGLGELTGGEGVFGLQRAFHLGGAQNVVASLWNVHDAATAALMTKFYHELWINKRPPIEAMREAQLTIYRRPDLILDLAGERGPPSLKVAIAVKTDANAKRQTTADTKLWAAFVLSGVGR